MRKLGKIQRDVLIALIHHKEWEFYPGKPLLSGWVYDTQMGTKKVLDSLYFNTPYVTQDLATTTGGHNILVYKPQDSVHIDETTGNLMFVREVIS
jgi:hypothetical protein